MHLFNHVTPAMGQLIRLIALAMMPGQSEARCSLKCFDENLNAILGVFGENYVDAADEFVASLRD